MRTPYYIMHEARLRQNLALISQVAERAGCQVIPALKAFALWRVFPIFREYGVSGAAASGPYEARLAHQRMGVRAHTFSPAFRDDEFGEVLAHSSHVTFNSLSQYRRLAVSSCDVSFGLRVNPEYSEIKTELYNPCAPGSRFGVLAEELSAGLPPGIEGLHCHCHCESGADELARTLVHIERKFGRHLHAARWLNLGGGHLMTREGYDIDLLVSTLRGLRERYPQLHVILEPGSAFAWQTGELVASVVDIVENHGISTAILDVSFTAHMPDCLEMPYTPSVLGACDTGRAYRLGGNSCLSGDYMGTWRFGRDLRVGDRIVLEDMIHYTTVKTTMFNGVPHPALALRRLDGSTQVLREFGYEDYEGRMC